MSPNDAPHLGVKLLYALVTCHCDPVYKVNVKNAQCERIIASSAPLSSSLPLSFTLLLTDNLVQRPDAV